MLSSTDSFKQLEQLTKKNNQSYYSLGKELGLPTSFFSEWKRGKMMPKSDKLLILANYFGVPLEYFIKGEEDV